MSRDAVLLGVFELSEADVDAMRRGTLSPAQAERVRAATRKDAVFMTAMAAVLTIVLGSILGILIDDGRVFRDAETTSDKIAIGAIVLIAGVLPLGAVAWAAWTWVAHVRMVPCSRSVEGPTRLTEHRHRGRVLLSEIAVGGRKFGVSERVFAALRDGARYRVFYVPTNDVVVGIEELTE